MIVDAGKVRMADLLKTDFINVAVGDGGDDTSTAQTTMDNLIAEKAADSIDRQGNTIVYTVTFTGSELNANVINELGIFNDETPKKLLTRVNFNSIGPLSSSDSVAFTFRLVIE